MRKTVKHENKLNYCLNVVVFSLVGLNVIPQTYRVSEVYVWNEMWAYSILIRF